MIMNGIKEYPGEETKEFLFESEQYDHLHPMKNKKTLIKRAVRIGLWTITGMIFTIFISSPVVFHYWINH
jgi:hypothetical protein